MKLGPAGLLLFHVSATLGMTPRDVAQRSTWADMMLWKDYFEQVNGVSRQSGVNPQTADSSQILAEFMK